jgi:aminoglycoside phosphotransferase (APT) family kinase protein
MGMTPGVDTHGLALALDPVLHAECRGRLGPIQWFRSAWQRGGSETGASTWRGDDGTTIEAIVKLPVGSRELTWSRRLSEAVTGAGRRAPTPRVLASGGELGGYDLAWLVIERVAGKPVAASLNEAAVHAMLEAVADFHDAAGRAAAVETPPKSPDWDRLLEKARQNAREGAIPEGQRWNDAIRKVQRSLLRLRAEWESRAINAWCHGDVHPGNALRPCDSADPAVAGRCTLIDLALVHPGHWVEDALYLERQFWGHGDLLCGVKPVSVLARLRRERGLSTNDQYAEVANVRRVLMAACAPAVTEVEGCNAKYLHSALEQIERFLPMVVHHG